MRVSSLLMPTLKEAPADYVTLSSRLMARAGLVRRISPRLYNYLPLGLKVRSKIEESLRRELEKLRSQEIDIPGLVYKETPENSHFFVDILKKDVKSYRAFPLYLYRIGQILNTREKGRDTFINSRVSYAMEAYFFEKDNRNSETSYEIIYKLFSNVLGRLNMRYCITSYDEFNTQEFITHSHEGEDEFITCSQCDYIADVKTAKCLPEGGNSEEFLKLEKISTPDIKTIDELKAFLQIDAKKLVKTLIYKIDGKTVAALIRGDRSLNEKKLLRLIKGKSIVMADKDVVEKVTDAELGFAGPIGIKADILVADDEVLNMKNWAAGANDTGYHYINVNYGKDFTADIIGDLKVFTEKDNCPYCSSPVSFKKGIKIGHLSKIGTELAGSINAYYIDEDGSEKYSHALELSMDIDRIIVSIIEQHNDESGIIWPILAAPFDVVIIPVISVNEEQVKLSESIYENLVEMGFNVLLDDRNERAGVKFKDADLVGIPIRITVGKKAGEGIVEYKKRTDIAPVDVKVEDVYPKIKKEFDIHMDNL
ncbi:proline--tRNA ligase [Oxobacter pfennigii]|uniref:Proline--tRNA ligase n=2 Tax=Oxobacter pfennigii TaxID=36849 RepID=A0A0P8WWJ7_9CLOT|nr:proline--tRNA ligase [Oxobacter pfennigii]